MTNATDDADIEASRAPLLDHLIELRSRLIKSLAAFVVMFFACFFVSRHIYNCPTSAPVGQIEGLHERRMAGSS